MPLPNLQDHPRILSSVLATAAGAASLLAVTGASAQDLPSCGSFPGGDEAYLCQCAAGSASGSVWGSGPYTSDSSICAAATHAGVIDESGGPVSTISVMGLDVYIGTEANGVTTSDWGAYGSSFIFDANAF